MCFSNRPKRRLRSGYVGLFIKTKPLRDKLVGKGLCIVGLGSSFSTPGFL